MLVLSLFPGIGLFDQAFELEGFTVVRGPDVLWGGDIHTFHPPLDKFDGVIGGPPCQAFSRLRHLVEHNGYQTAPNLIPEFERCVSEAKPDWFVMENVPDAPNPEVDGYQVRDQILNNRWVGGVQNRLRRFNFGTHSGLELLPEITLFEDPQWEPAVMASGGANPRPVAIGGSGKVKAGKANQIGYASTTYLKRACELQGLPGDFLNEAPFTVAGKVKVVGNGVPLPMGRSIARAVKAAFYKRA